MSFDRLVPLSQILRRHEISYEQAQIYARLLEGGETRAVIDELGGSTARDCLEYAGILDDDHAGTEDAGFLFMGAAALAALPEKERVGWQPVVTLPGQFRSLIPDSGLLETSQVLRRLVVSAERELILAAPFLDSGIEQLFPAVAELVNGGGTCLVITRDLVVSGKKGRNRPVVDALRALVSNRTGLRVEGWSGEGLGIHMKVVVADKERCYIGSANLTRGGLERHIEIGVYCEGEEVGEIAEFMEAVADGVKAGRIPQAR